MAVAVAYMKSPKFINPDEERKLRDKACILNYVNDELKEKRLEIINILRSVADDLDKHTKG